MTRIKTTEIVFRGQRLQCMPNQLSVKAAPHLAKDPDAAEKALRTALGPGVDIRFLFPFDERGIASIELTEEADLESVADQVERSAEFVRAAPITITKISAGHGIIHRPADPLYPQQWGAEKIRMPEAWGYMHKYDFMRRSDGICVAVLDTGLPFAGNPPKPFHQDMETAKRFLAGINAVAPGTSPNDDNKHGTHVTGIVAAEHGKRRGTAGINWRCKVYVGKVFDSAGVGNPMLLYQATKMAVTFARSRGWRLVINFSGGGPFDPLYEDIGDVVTSGGALLVAAAGNDTGPVSYPAALSTKSDGSMWYANVCAVAATDQNDKVAPFSNFGPQINVAAPGVDIISTLPYPLNGEPEYGLLSGTSMAAPHVSGVATLIWAKESTLAAGHVREQLEATSIDLGAGGRDPQYGFGRVDAYKAVRYS